MPDTILTETPAPTVSPSNRSPEIDKLAAALAKAQSAMDGARKDKSNPHFKSAYADIASVWDAIREPLASNGLSVVQLPTTVKGGVDIETLLFHESGQFLRNVLWMPCAQQMTAHTIGSAITYGRRYALMAVVGVAPEDDDGNSATGRNGNADDQPHKPGPAGSAGGGTDFRPAGPRRMPTSNWVDDAEKDGIVDTDRTKGSLAKSTNGNGKKTAALNAVELAQWCKDSIATFATIATKPDLVAWWKDHRETREEAEAKMPSEFERVLVAYDKRMDTVAAKVA